MQLSSMVDGIAGYAKVLEQNGYKAAGTGDKAWTTKHENAVGAYVEVCGTGWTIHSKTGVLAAQGATHKDLRTHFLSYKNKAELLAYIEKHM